MLKLSYALKLFVFGTMVLPYILFAQDGVIQLKNFVQQVKSADGEFIQQQVSSQLGSYRKARVTKTLEGKFSFLRLGKFIWEVQKPFEQKMIADGKQLILWDKDLNQATYRPSSQALAATPAAIIFGDVALDKYFDLSPVGEKGGLVWVELTPKVGKANIEDIPYSKIGIGMSNDLPQAMELRDNFGNVVLLTLSKIKTNTVSNQNRFLFNPPAGTEIVKLQ